jgi:hypothetical protein
MSSSFGPVQTAKPKHGECRYCFDENHTRDTGASFESRWRMIGPVCGHRLRPFKRFAKLPQINRSRAAKLSEGADYWTRRAWLPDYCGEPGERSRLELAGMGRMDDAQVEAVLSNIGRGV